jgi:CBS domain-containing protein
MLVRELMSEPLVTVPADTDLQAATARMLDHGVGSLLVVSEDEPDEPYDATPTGILTKTDIMSAACRTDEPLSTLSVTDATSRPLVTLEPDRTVSRALNLMADNDTRHLVVIDDFEPVGMLTITDIAFHHDEIRDEAIELAGRPLGARRK